MIRKAELKDALDIYNLEILCFSSHYSLDTIQNDLQNEKISFYVYEKNNEIVGYISIYNFLGEANLQKIAVIEKERRKGLATELIRYAISELKKVDTEKFYLEVNEKNLIVLSSITPVCSYTLGVEVHSFIYANKSLSCFCIAAVPLLFAIKDEKTGLLLSIVLGKLPLNCSNKVILYPHYWFTIVISAE